MKTLFCLLYINLIFLINDYAQAAMSMQLPLNDSLLSVDNIFLETPVGKLHGTLTIPESVKAPPVVLLISGSGPTDRNCNARTGLHTDAFLKIAQELKNAGIASLRYDKRSTGLSVGGDESTLTIDDYINDAIGWIKLLRSGNRFSKIFVFGHSEGSLIGMIAAAAEPVDGFISAAGAGERANVIIQRQIKNVFPEKLYNCSVAILDTLKRGEAFTHAIPPELSSIFRQSAQSYLISWMKYDPQQEIKKVRVPIFVIQGTNDLQVSVADAELLAHAANKASLCLLNNMNHIFVKVTGAMEENIASYYKPALPLHPDLIDTLVHFIKSPGASK